MLNCRVPEGTKKNYHLITICQKADEAMPHFESRTLIKKYLCDFGYKLNRRNFADILERVIIAAVFPYWYESE